MLLSSKKRKRLTLKLSKDVFVTSPAEGEFATEYVIDETASCLK